MSEETITLDKRQFPYVVVEDESAVTSMTVISFTRTSEEYFGDEQVLFYLANAELQVSNDSHSPRSFVKVRHSFARDEEGDRAYIAYLDVASVQFTSSYDRTMNFTGWLTEAPKFWPESEPSPFVDIEREAEPAEGEGFFYANSGYPYTPPAVLIPGFKTPIMVEIQVTHDSPERMAEWLVRIRESIEEKRIKREEKARIARKEAAERKVRVARIARLLKQYTEEQPNGAELRAMEKELDETTGDDRREFVNGEKYKRLRELRMEWNAWLDAQPAD